MYTAICFTRLFFLLIPASSAQHSSLNHHPPPGPNQSSLQRMASTATPVLLDLAWAVLTMQLMVLTFWFSSEDIRQRLLSAAALPPPSMLLDDSPSVELKKRRRRLNPKSVWDAEQVRANARSLYTTPSHIPPRSPSRSSAQA